MLEREFTAVYKKRGKHYIAWVEEIPGVNTQGKTKKETRENLKEALFLILEANREISSLHSQANTFRESLRLAVPA